MKNLSNELRICKELLLIINHYLYNDFIQLLTTSSDMSLFFLS